jgi:hypothetical protein
MLGKGALGSGKREILTLSAGWEFQDYSRVHSPPPARVHGRHDANKPKRNGDGHRIRP